MINRRQFIKKGGLWVTGAVAFPNVVARANRVVNRGGGGGPPSLMAFNETFTAGDSDSLGSNWTEAAGDIDIFSNSMRLSAAPWADNFAIYTGAACATADQFIRFVYTTEGGYPQIPFRYTNSTSPFYYAEFSNTTVDWYRVSQIGGSTTKINASAGSVTLSSGVGIGITCVGTGNSTEFKIWINPTSGSPNLPSTWGAATVTFTDNPGSPVDSGPYVGMGGVQGTANTVRFDTIYGGDYQ